MYKIPDLQDYVQSTVENYYTLDESTQTLGKFSNKYTWTDGDEIYLDRS